MYIRETVDSKIHTDGQLVEQVREFRYLRSLISEERYGYCEKEIHSTLHIAMRKKIFMDKKRLFTAFSGKLNLELRKL